MFVNSISAYGQNLYVKKSHKQNSTLKAPVITNYGVDKVSFQGGPKPDVLKNQMKILLSQDIWAVNLSVKMPETSLERETLLEILQNRLKLDRFARLTNERAKLKGLISYIKSLSNQNPSHKDLPQLLQELKKYGNIDSTLKTLDKNILLEAKKNKPAMDYFNNLAKIENEYLDKRIIKPAQLEKFWHKVVKNNINADGQHSTKELIEIVSNEQIQEVTSAKGIKAAAPQLSKKQLLLQIEKQYENYLRENIEIYEGRMDRSVDAQIARKLIYKTNIEGISRYPGIEKQFSKIYETVENKFTYKIDRLDGIDIYPIGEIWQDMRPVEAAIKSSMKEISLLNEQLAKDPANKKLQAALSKQEKALSENREDWIRGMKFSIKYEGLNRERISSAGRLAEYDYLTGESKTLKRHKNAFEIYNNNNESIPDEYWTQILA